MKVIISESQYNRVVDYFITFLIEPHEAKIIPKYPNLIFWVKNGEAIAEIENHKYFWLHYKIWDEISIQFGLDYNETQSVIKHWLEQHYGLEKLTFSLLPGDWDINLEHYGLEELTPPREEDGPSLGWNNIMDL